MANLNPRRLATIAKWQEDLVESGKLPNVQVVVWRNGEVAFNETRGNLRKNVAAPNDAIYRFYSMTKPIVSVALMQLYEQGRFRLTDPVHLYLGDRWKKKNMTAMFIRRSDSSKKLRWYHHCALRMTWYQLVIRKVLVSLIGNREQRSR